MGRTRIELSPTAAAIAKVLADHVSDLPTRRPVLTYTEVRERAERSFAMIGIGKYLGEIVVALHNSGVPHGLTLFVGPVNGPIPYSDDPTWCGIKADNALMHRRAVMDFDWSTVEFVKRESAPVQSARR